MRDSNSQSNDKLNRYSAAELLGQKPLSGIAQLVTTFYLKSIRALSTCHKKKTIPCLMSLLNSTRVFMSSVEKSE